MLRKIDHKNMGKSDFGWLRNIFHFSYADYFILIEMAKSY